MAISKEKLIAEVDTPIEGDSVASFLRDGEGTKLTSTLNGGKQALDVFITNPLEIDVNLDAGDDSIAAWLKDGSGNSLSSTSGALHVRLDSQTVNIVVEATDFDIRNLTAAQDKVDARMDASSIATSAASVGTTAAALVASALSNRRRLLIQNLGANAIFLGGASVTTSTGIRIPAGANVELEIGAGVNLHALCASGSADVRILEMA
jgi:hypothetical protein